MLRAGVLGNRLVLVGVGAEVAVFVALVLLPPLARVFGLEPLRPAEWGVLLLFPGVVLGLEEARKAVLRRRGSPQGHREGDVRTGDVDRPALADGRRRRP